jgi:hypothetical protein
MNDEKSGGDFLNDLGNAVRANPLPAALVGMGLVWLFAGRKSLRTRNIGEAMSDTAISAGSMIRDRGAEAVQGISGAASSPGGASLELARSAPAMNGQLFATARSNLSDLLQKQPLLLGAFGVALGAGIAASLRISDPETALLGEASANFQGRAQNFAANQTKRAANLADGVATTIAQEAHAQGLTPDGLKSTASEAGQKVKNVLDQAVGSVRDRINKLGVSTADRSEGSEKV